MICDLFKRTQSFLPDGPLSGGDSISSTRFAVDIARVFTHLGNIIFPEEISLCFSIELKIYERQLHVHQHRSLLFAPSVVLASVVVNSLPGFLSLTTKNPKFLKF